MLLFRRRPRWRAVTGPLAALMLLLAVASVAGAAPASARPAPPAAGTKTAAKPVAGKAPLSKLIGQPVRHVRLPAAPRKFTQAPRQPKLPAGQRSACPVPGPGQVSCSGIIRTASAQSTPGKTAASAGTRPAGTAKAGTSAAAAGATPSGFSPAQLQSAYNLASASATGGIANGAPEAVAVVTPYDDPNAAADLAAYRTQYGLAPCVTTAGGALPVGSGCVTKVNENNQSSPLPSAPPSSAADWTAVASADMDMVTAACPNCQILLAEAGSDQVADGGQALLTAENDADVIVGGWGAAQFAGQDADSRAYLNAPGKALVFAGGDTGTGEAWPASSQYVTAVGGTTLTADASASRGWDETAWSGSSAGCSSFEPKPAWQSDTGCGNRTQNDVSAVADPSTPVSVYDSTAPADGDGRATDWASIGSTSVSAGIIAGIYALNGLPQAGTYPASYPYQSGNSGNFNDITSGSDGTCESNRSYLCTAGTGYDGPTGTGTPNGAAGLSDQASGDTVSVPDPGTQDYAASQKVNIPLKATSSDSSQAITWTATGLPDGLAVNSATGAVTGTLPSSAGTSKVTVTATDATGATGSASFNISTLTGLDSGWTATSGPYTSGVSGMCVDDPASSTAAGTAVHAYACNSGANQNWTFSPSASPAGSGGAGTIEPSASAGMCLTMSGVTSGSTATLQKCSGGDGHQGWQLRGNGQLYNPLSGYCLADPGNSSTNNTQLDIEACNTAATGQQWTLPAGQILSAGGKCLDDYQASAANNTIIDNHACNGTGAQNWTLEPGGTIQVQGTCLDMKGQSKLDGGLAELYTCNGGANQEWQPLPDGEIMNKNSGKCLDDTTGTQGTQLQQQDCYGDPGEIWEAS
ncbi:MAG: ricin-type beta-trefoil lectin domain protein [Streptosporangiales bacterium]|nr:ricin-type beta-trefoil lectin domain protein [Streptosporangiales bacterium]